MREILSDPPSQYRGLVMCRETRIVELAGLADGLAAHARQQHRGDDGVLGKNTRSFS